MSLMSGINYMHFLIHIIRPSLKCIGIYSKNAEMLLLGTAVHESCCGHYIKQIQGPALGVYQIEPNTHQDVWTNFINYRTTLRTKIIELYPNLSTSINDDILVYDLRYATIIARLIYIRAKGALPNHDDLNGQAQYWKQHYNTKKGKGTVSAYISSFNRLCK